MSENKEPAAKDHKLSGTIRFELSKCKVLLPVGVCTVDEPIAFEATFVGVDGLLDTKSGKENAMGLRIKGEGGSGENKDLFANITYRGEKCPFKNQTFPIRGSFTATSGPTTESGQENKHSGATFVIGPKFKMQSIKLGPEPVELETILTWRMAEKGNPITLTTTT